MFGAIDWGSAISNIASIAKNAQAIKAAKTKIPPTIIMQAPATEKILGMPPIVVYIGIPVLILSGIGIYFLRR
ncbi:MAG: hypothetical protein KKD48_04580 [Nanoarchaeota archaeon]|nr:hypothetical protein [Nanoarchaeota archaeon]